MRGYEGVSTCPAATSFSAAAASAAVITPPRACACHRRQPRNGRWSTVNGSTLGSAASRPCRGATGPVLKGSYVARSRAYEAREGRDWREAEPHFGVGSKQIEGVKRTWTAADAAAALAAVASLACQRQNKFYFDLFDLFSPANGKMSEAGLKRTQSCGLDQPHVTWGRTGSIQGAGYKVPDTRCLIQG
eukprot:787235-Prorocentrum_minimum.AAC.6